MGVSENHCFLAMITYLEKLAAALGSVDGKKVLDLDVLAAAVRALDDPHSNLLTGEKQWLAHEHQYQGFLELLAEFTNPTRKGAALTFSMQQRLRGRFFKWFDGASNLPHWKELKTARWANYKKCVSFSLDCECLCRTSEGLLTSATVNPCAAIRFYEDHSASTFRFRGRHFSAYLDCSRALAEKATPYRHTLRDSAKLDLMLEIVRRYLAAVCLLCIPARGRGCPDLDLSVPCADRIPKFLLDGQVLR